MIITKVVRRKIFFYNHCSFNFNQDKAGLYFDEKF